MRFGLAVKAFWNAANGRAITEPSRGGKGGKPSSGLIHPISLRDDNEQRFVRKIGNGESGGSDGTRTRDLWRDRPAL